MGDDVHLRLVWPQWQGAGSTSVRALAAELPFDQARRAYADGTAVLQALLPAHDGPEEVVPVRMDDVGLESRDGIEAKDAVLAGLRDALDLIERHRPARITTLGGDCGVSVAPFSALIDRYGDDLAVVWIDSHPDMATGASPYDGWHAMAVAALTGRGDADVQALLPGVLPAERVVLVGMHDWTDDSFPAAASSWGLQVLPPDALRTDGEALVARLRTMGVGRVAVHLDVDVVDSDEARLGLGQDRGGLTIAQTRRVVEDLRREVDVVGFTVAEFVPRQLLQLRRLLDGMPLLD